MNYNYAACRKYIMRDTVHPAIGFIVWLLLLNVILTCPFFIIAALRFPVVQWIAPSLYEPFMFDEALLFCLYFAFNFSVPAAWILAYTDLLSFRTFHAFIECWYETVKLLAPAAVVFLVLGCHSWYQYSLLYEHNVFIHSAYYGILYIPFSFVLFVYACVFYNELCSKECWETLKLEEEMRAYEQNHEARVTSIYNKLISRMKREIEQYIEACLNAGMERDKIIECMEQDPRIQRIYRDFGFAFYKVRKPS